MNRTPSRVPHVALVLLIVSSGCGDQKILRRIARLDVKTIIETQNNYLPKSKVSQVIAEGVKLRNVSEETTTSAPPKTPSPRVAKALPKGKPQPLIPYTVISREEYLHHKVSFDLRVDLVDGRLPSKEELGAVSEHIKSREKPHDRTFVSFLLPGMRPGSGAFASAHHNPEMEVKIYPYHIPEGFAGLLDEEPSSKPVLQPPEPSSVTQSKIDVTMSIQIEWSGRRPVIVGKTSLPDGTSIMTSVSCKTANFMAQDKTTVQAGRFTAGPFGRPTGLAPGDYVADATMPIPQVQPTNIQLMIGDKGQNLVGPLVKDSDLGRSVSVEHRFRVP